MKLWAWVLQFSIALCFEIVVETPAPNEQYFVPKEKENKIIFQVKYYIKDRGNGTVNIFFTLELFDVSR